MRLRKFLLERHIVKSVTPYFMLALLVLTAVLLAQQSGKFTEELSAARAPFALTLEIALGVIPGIVLFSLPMAVLIGTTTGFARMGSDSELIAFGAAGLSRWKLAIPMLVFGVFLAAVTVFDGFVIAPAAAHSMRRVMLDAALERLESPVQPGAFNTQMPGKVIYIRDGNETRGEWGRVFIHWSEPGGELRLITARAGRLDSSGDQTELVLNDAVVTTIPSTERGGVGAGRAVVTERSAQFRIRLNGGRAATLSNQLARAVDYDEMGWGDLRKSYKEGSESQRRTALSALHKRLALAVTPISFVLLGVGMGARSRRGGRASGASYSIVAMVLFYLIFLGGDYLVRAGEVSPPTGAWAATVFTCAFGVLLILFKTGGGRIFHLAVRAKDVTALRHTGDGEVSKGKRLSLLGLLDRSVLTSLVINFSVALMGLVAVFLIFTFFEMLRFVAANGSQARLIPAYLFYLIPLALTGVMPVSTLLSVLTTYALMAKRSEAISWWASGQSLYRLALPSLSFAVCVCALVWLVQEKILPVANTKQESLRARIRGGPVRADAPSGDLWLAVTDQQLYSYRFKENSDILEKPVLYRFDREGVHLTEIVRGRVARQSRGGGVAVEDVQELRDLDNPEKGISELNMEEVIDENSAFELFKPQLKQPSEYDTHSLSGHLKRLSTTGRNSSQLPLFAVTFWRRQVEPLGPLIMWINGLPLALAFGRKSTVLPLLFAVIIGISYWLGLNLFAQMGVYGIAPPFVAVTVLPFFFFLTGIYYFSKART